MTARPIPLHKSSVCKPSGYKRGILRCAGHKYCAHIHCAGNEATHSSAQGAVHMDVIMVEVRDMPTAEVRVGYDGRENPHVVYR